MSDPFSAPLAEKVVVGVVVLFLTWAAARVLGRFLHRILRRDEVDIPANSILVNIVKAVIWFIGIAFLLSLCFNIDVTAMITGLGVVGIAVSLGMQDTLSDFISGVIVSLHKVVVAGEYIRVNGAAGKVLDVNWRETKILDADGNVRIIPNSIISNQEIVHLNEVGTVVVPVLFPFFNTEEEIATHCEKVKEAATKAASELVELQAETVVAFTGSNYAGMDGSIKLFVEWGSVDQRLLASTVMKAVAPFTSREAC